jgi:ATP-binding protein involved in chromosome partitioning
MSIAPEGIVQALRTVLDPATKRDILRNDQVRDLQITDRAVKLTLLVKDPDSPFAKQAPTAIAAAINEGIDPQLQVQVAIDTPMIGLGEDMIMNPGKAAKPDFGRAHVIAIASGKGGVGKSTVAVNLAAALTRAGYAVGLVDTDIYGPSIPTMFGITDEKPRVNERRKIIPIERAGVKLLSMGFLTDPDQAVIWRGPMVSNAVRQFLGDAEWGDLDFLLLDLPPGTGDIQLTIVQTVALTGAIIVSTPQKVALDDAKRGVAMFKNVEVPVLGIIENMAYFTPPDLPEKKYYLFGEGGARRLAQDLEVPFLGEIAIDQALRESGDEGVPLAAASIDTESGRAFISLAEQTATQTALHKARLPAQEKVEIVYRS